MTLLEVLIAIFVMAIGIFGVMALFMVGAVTMAGAIKQQRAAEACANAKAWASANSIQFDTMVAPYFINPLGDVPASAKTVFLDAPPNGPSWAVYVDPVGYLTSSKASKDYVAGDIGHIRRRPLSFVSNNATMLKWCFCQDEITFSEDGTPYKPNGGFIERASNISWAWLLRRPTTGIVNCCEMTVVVYYQRPINTGLPQAAGEMVYIGDVDYKNQLLRQLPKDLNFVTLRWGVGKQPAPQVREGSWILDKTANNTAGLPASAKFYKVVGVGDVVPDAFAPKTVLRMDIELATPVLGSPGNERDITSISSDRSFVVMPDVYEVFECGMGWKSGPTVPTSDLY